MLDIPPEERMKLTVSEINMMEKNWGKGIRKGVSPKSTRNDKAEAK